MREKMKDLIQQVGGCDTFCRGLLPAVSAIRIMYRTAAVFTNDYIRYFLIHGLKCRKVLAGFWGLNANYFLI